jgi:hypothetical protein
MSKKTSTSSRKIPATKAKAKVAQTVSTPVRYSAIPKAVTAAPAKPVVTSELIAIKAFELFAAGRSGSEMDHWLAAEAELKSAA